MWEDFVTNVDGNHNSKTVKLSTSKTIDVPAMPCSESPVNPTPHQRREAHPLVHYAMVARSVGKQEATTEPKAVAAMKSELSNMHKKVWNLWDVREKSDLRREAKQNGMIVQFGRVH